MTDGDLQIRTLLNHLCHLGNLVLVVSKTHRKDHSPTLHEFEDRHQREQRLVDTMTREGDTLQSSVDDSLCLVRIPGHAHTEKAVGILLLHLRQVGVLTTIYHLLYHNGGTHLRIVHVRQEHLSRVLSVNHKRRQHLHLLVHEDAPAVLQRQDTFPVDGGILFQPQMTVGIDYEFAHVTRCWLPIISFTSRTKSQSGSSLAHSILRRTFSGLAEENSVEAMRGLLTENCTASFSIG